MAEEGGVRPIDGRGHAAAALMEVGGWPHTGRVMYEAEMKWGRKDDE